MIFLALFGPDYDFCFFVVNLDDLVLPGAVSGSVPTGLHAVAISRQSAGAMPSTFAFVKTICVCSRNMAVCFR